MKARLRAPARRGPALFIALCLLGLMLLAVPAAEARTAADQGLASVAAYRSVAAGPDYLSDTSTGAISGIVTDGNGKAVGGVWVAAYRGTASGYVSDTSTDATTGEYYLPGLLQGVYRVRFFDDVGFFLPQWFDGVSTRASAKSVPVVSGATTEGVDATMLAKVVLGKPTCPRSVKHGRRFTASGTVRPQFLAGTRTVMLTAYRLTHHKWKFYRRYAALNSDSGGSSKYSAHVRISRRGSYRFMATVKATAVWAGAKAGYSRKLTVK